MKVAHRMPSPDTKDRDPQKVAREILEEDEWLKTCSGITKYTPQQVRNMVEQVARGKVWNSNTSSFWTAIQYHYCKYIRRKKE